MMTAIVRAPAISELSLASLLLEHASNVRPRKDGPPCDGTYRDYLLGTALQHIVAGLNGDPEREDLEECADRIASCYGLGGNIASQLSGALRQVAGGKVSVLLAAEIARAAIKRIAHDIRTESLRATGADGFTLLTDAVDGLSGAGSEAQH